MREGHGHKGKHGRRDHSEHRGFGHLNKDGMKEFSDQHPKSAQTFRRGRALAFLDKLMINRSTLQRQIKEPEFESIKQVISGELKATEAIIEEFIHMFQLHETISEEKTAEDNEMELKDSKDDSINENI